MLGRVATAIGDAGGSIGSVDLVAIEHGHTLRDITIETAGEEHAQPDRPGRRRSRRRPHGRHHRPHVPDARRRQDRAAQQAAGAAPATTSAWPTRPASRASAWRSHKDRDQAFQYTIKRNTVAVVSDGSAVLGLGDIGPEAAMPVMEGKAVLFKEFGGVDAFPICLVHQGPGRDRPDRHPHRARVRRHQPRGHQRPALLRDRGAPEGHARHPGLPRRPARHRGRHARRADQRRQAHRQGPQATSRS